MRKYNISFFTIALAMAFAFFGAAATRAYYETTPSPSPTAVSQGDCMKADEELRVANLKKIQQTYKAALADALKTFKSEQSAKNPDAKKHYLAARKAALKAKITATIAENARHKANHETCKAAKPAEVSASEIEIKDFSFKPESLEVSVGTKVTWKQGDSSPHQVISDDGLFEGPVMQTGDVFTYTFDKAGTFSYHCNIHPSMKGAVVVK